jgi:hypothetical protein
MRHLRSIALLKGAATFVPGLLRFALRGSGGTDQPRYCYAVWMRHLVSISAAGLNADPRSIAGDSLGIGLAAMLTGATSYDAFDARPHASAARNPETLDELVNLLAARAPIPDANEFTEVLPRLAGYEFPSHVLNDERLRRTLEPSRVEAIRRALHLGTPVDGLRIGYAAPWYDAAVLQPEAVDVVFSQAVLEHIDEIEATCVPPARTETAPAFRSLSDEVLRTAGAYVIAVKA